MPARVAVEHRGVIEWTAGQLEAATERWVAGWPKTVRLHIAGLGEVLFCHATPQDENEIVTRETPLERAAPMFRDCGAAVAVCGHTHMRFDRMMGSVRVINAGSVGMPFGEAGADWLLLGPDVQPRHTAYDLSAAAARIRASAYPGAEEFAARSVLRPPSEEEMLAAFGR